MKIALVGNPNAGKTTLFNAYTGSTQYVGNWPGVTVEKKEGIYKKNKDIKIMDLPGIYSLSPYTSEEVITRDFLLNENPDVIINIIDVVNLERNLYLTSQVLDMNIPTVIALNRMDMIEGENIKLDYEKLSKKMGVTMIPIIATKNVGIEELINEAIKQAGETPHFTNFYSARFNQLLDLISFRLPEEMQDKKNYHAIKIIENDKDAFKKNKYDKFIDQEVKDAIRSYLIDMDDDGESSVINEKYESITKLIDGIYQKNIERKLSTSEKIDKVITNKWLGLPIFFLIMWFIYHVSITTVGDMTIQWVEGGTTWLQAVVQQALDSLGASHAVQGLIVNGIIGSLSAIFTFVPQLMILFLFLSILEDSGYMSRVAFIMDRVFRKFGLSGKSFIPMLIGTGCSVPGIMATRTIESENDRNMTIILTPFVPCGAKLPVFIMFITMMFPHSSWVGPAIYLIAFAVIILSGLFLKKTKYFKGDPAPFVMELPPYTLPTAKGVWLHMWDRAKDFIKKAGSVIFLANLILWLLMNFGFNLQYVEGHIENSILAKIGNVIRYLFIPLGFGENWAASIASLTGLIAKETIVSTFATIGTVIPIEFTQVSAFAFIIFTIFSAPCFAAIGAMKRELNNKRLTWFALFYQTAVAYILAMLTNQIGSLIFKGTSAMDLVVLDNNNLEQASESLDAIVNGEMYGYIALGIIAVIIVITMYTQFFKKEEV